MLRNEPVQPWAERTVLPSTSSPSPIHWLQLRDWSGDDTEELACEKEKTSVSTEEWTGLRNQGGKGTEPD